MTDIALARGHYLRPNGLGGYIIRQSDLSSWSRCQLEKFYDDRAANEYDAPQPAALSATEFGSVIHYCVMNMEQAMHEGREDALQVGLDLFKHYWDLDNMTALPGVRRITEWLPRQTYGGLRERGRITLKTYYGLLKDDKSWPLALEYTFAVPLEIDGRLHTVTGTVDRLSIRQASRGKPYVSVDDLKTGKRPYFLRYNMQGTTYCWATTMPEFWLGWPESGMGALEHFDDELMGRLTHLFSRWSYRLHRGETHSESPLASRRFRWIDLKEIKFADGGWRVDQDYERMKLAIDAYVRGNEAGVYSINTTGEICRYCSHKGNCGGVGLAPETAGAP